MNEYCMQITNVYPTSVTLYPTTFTYVMYYISTIIKYLQRQTWYESFHTQLSMISTTHTMKRIYMKRNVCVPVHIVEKDVFKKNFCVVFVVHKCIIIIIICWSDKFSISRTRFSKLSQQGWINFPLSIHIYSTSNIQLVKLVYSF